MDASAKKLKISCCSEAGQKATSKKISSGAVAVTKAKQPLEQSDSLKPHAVPPCSIHLKPIDLPLHYESTEKLEQNASVAVPKTKSPTRTSVIKSRCKIPPRREPKDPLHRLKDRRFMCNEM